MDVDERPKRVRVKVSAFSNLNVAERQIRLGGLVLCSTSACYQPETAPYIDLRTTSTLGPANIADFMMPPSTITHVYLTPIAGGAGLEGSLALETPFTFDKDFFGGEIMLVVAKRGNGYAPVQSATGLIGGPPSTSVYYIPNTATVARLPKDVVLTLPAGAMARPAVFNTLAHDTGNRFPMVDVYPYVDLAVPGTIDMRAIARPPKGLTAGAPPPTPAVAMVPAPAYPANRQGAPVDDNATSSKTTFIKTGVFHGYPVRPR
ncbi:hypothetical protein [Massilia pseudoviolaceinigra]|uniref:hypothetical protein n=1 Tax=Massilia pseudoviolaceinigra TaxID=3057165 RepID=UPI002796C77A|nr:hypothetical protein [Massilia sp. CCM 9206]MDQ1922695.1 hypothetical protein [Massilia sp. CCM 9206]